MTISCPKCSSKAIKRNGFTRHGKQNHRCLECGRQFSLEPEAKYVVEVSPAPGNINQAPTSFENDSSSSHTITKR